MLTMLVGQKGRLIFLAAQAGVDPASVLALHWTQQGAPTSIRFTQPDQVEALVVGTSQFTCAADGPGQARWVYVFTIEVLAQEPPPPVTLPVVIEPVP